jgi:hypothetical protein
MSVSSHVGCDKQQFARLALLVIAFGQTRPWNWGRKGGDCIRNRVRLVPSNMPGIYTGECAA